VTAIAVALAFFLVIFRRSPRINFLSRLIVAEA
jgi:hypothetical protein